MCASLLSLTCAHTGSPEAWVCSISEDHVVDQLRFADPDGADGGVPVTHVGHPIFDALRGEGQVETDFVILDEAHYRAKFGVNNPNLPVLAQLKKGSSDS